MDHIVPQVKGGSDDPGNLQTLCKSCNSWKKDRDPEQQLVMRLKQPMSPVPPEFSKQAQRNADKAAERRRSIIQRLKTGESQAAIAKSIGVTRNVIWRIAQRARHDGQL